MNASHTTVPPPTLKVEMRGVTRNPDGSTGYELSVSFGLRRWIVVRRYSEFYAFHHKHVLDICRSSHSIRDMIHKQVNTLGPPELPPKKICNNRDAQFIAERKRHLAVYLRRILADNTLVRAALPTRKFLSDASPQRISDLFDIHIPLLRRGARFEKIGSVFTRDVWVQLTEDLMRLEYWQAGMQREAVDEIKSLRLYTVESVSETQPNLDSITISAERVAVLKHARLHFEWLKALQALQDLLHLYHPDSQTLLVEKKTKQQRALRDMHSSRDRAKRAFKRESLKNKYKR